MPKHLHHRRLALLALACAFITTGCQHAHHHPITDKPATIEVLAQGTESWDGTTLPAYPAGQPRVTVLRVTVQPYSRLPVHMHPGINAGVLLSGQIIVRTDSGRVRHCMPGDALIECVDTWHYGENPTAEPAEILIVYAGVVDQQLTVPQDPNQHPYDH